MAGGPPSPRQGATCTEGRHCACRSRPGRALGDARTALPIAAQPSLVLVERVGVVRSFGVGTGAATSDDGAPSPAFSSTPVRCRMGGLAVRGAPADRLQLSVQGRLGARLRHGQTHAVVVPGTGAPAPTEVTHRYLDAAADTLAADQGVSLEPRRRRAPGVGIRKWRQRGRARLHRSPPRPGLARSVRHPIAAPGQSR